MSKFLKKTFGVLKIKVQIWNINIKQVFINNLVNSDSKVNKSRVL